MRPTGTGAQRGRLLPRLTAWNAGFLLLLWSAETLVAERHWLTTLITYLPQHVFGVPAAGLLLWALGRREWRALAGNAAAFAFFVAALLGVNVPLTGRAMAAKGGDARVLRVMTYNIAHGSEGTARVAALVREQRPDLLCLQEANAHKRWRDPIPELRRLLPGWRVARAGDVATLARAPILVDRAYPLLLPKSSGRSILETVIELHGQRVTVLNAHINTAAGPTSIALYLDSLPGYLGATATVRSAQIATLLRVAEAASPPVLIAGDFNTPPRGLLYRRISSRFQDAFRGAGWGLGDTFPARLPLLRIDYIFADPGMAVRSCRVPNTRVSDHRPVVAEVVF